MSKQTVSLEITDRSGRRCAGSGSKWEPFVGYSRAVRSGNFIAVSGTVGLNPDGTYPPGIEEQTRRSLEIICAAIEKLGGKVEQVIRTRMFVTDIRQWERIGSVHGTFFGEIRPATSMVQVSKLIDDEAMIEIEADAVIPDGAPRAS